MKGGPVRAPQTEMSAEQKRAAARRPRSDRADRESASRAARDEAPRSR